MLNLKIESRYIFCSILGENHHYGTPVNPAAPSRVPGGSSSGSGVAVAANLVDISLGENSWQLHNNSHNTQLTATLQLYGNTTSHLKLSHVCGEFAMNRGLYDSAPSSRSLRLTILECNRQWYWRKCESSSIILWHPGLPPFSWSSFSGWCYTNGSKLGYRR